MVAFWCNYIGMMVHRAPLSTWKWRRFPESTCMVTNWRLSTLIAKTSVGNTTSRLSFCVVCTSLCRLVVLVWHFTAKWIDLLNLLQIYPNAWHNSLLWSWCHLPQFKQSLVGLELTISVSLLNLLQYQILLLPICSCIHFQVWFLFIWSHLFYTKSVFKLGARQPQAVS